VVNVALPKIQANLHTTLAAMQWVINAYMLCMSALLLIGGAAADQFGRRRLFLVGIVAFTIGASRMLTLSALGFAAKKTARWRAQRMPPARFRPITLILKTKVAPSANNDADAHQ